MHNRLGGISAFEEQYPNQYKAELREEEPPPLQVETPALIQTFTELIPSLLKKIIKRLDRIEKTH